MAKMSHYILIGYFPEAVENDTEPIRSESMRRSIWEEVLDEIIIYFSRGLSFGCGLDFK